MSFSFYPTLIGGRVNIQVPDAVNKYQSTSETPIGKFPKVVSVQAYSKDSWWGKFKVLISQAERFKDDNGNEYILNMRSLGKALQLTEGQELSKINARTKMAAFKRFFPEATVRTLEMVVEKCKIAAQSQAEQINKLKELESKKSIIALCKKHPILNTNLKFIINFRIKIKEGDVIRVNFYLKPNGGVVMSNFGQKACVTNREELTNAYCFVADLYLENEVYYINLKKDTAVHIETIDTWTAKSNQQEIDKQYENALAVIASCK
ncbi:hypothetical protein [Parachlamydia acanthamoebae]|uniref:Uncharacterized protein n=1 Tax=Parachlamydia acanthamoebae TaxID=83552 RepID=A0A0C1EBQ9_9BACT|nr:hypothetical protein [Parachlamydia acanthamoebae]KIA78527.1 hypothetical protein DB43_DV00020 [Parachlamydia acanthamoebae]